MKSSSSPVALGDSQVSFLHLVRGLAALAVVAGHVFTGVAGNFAFGKLHAWQSFAVVVFFWLSGFLIAYNCLVRPNYTFREYLIDRFARIYVLYIPAVAFSMLSLWILAKQFEGIPVVAGNLLMLHNTPFGRIFEHVGSVGPVGQNGPLWSIAVEWWLYMLFGGAFFWARSGWRARLGILLFLIPAAVICAFYLLHESVGWVWILGAACAYVFVHRTPGASKAVPMFCFLAALAFLVRFHLLSPPGAYVNMYDMQMALCTSSLLLGVLVLVERMPNWRWYSAVAARLAFCSYALYLFHEPMRRLFFLQLLKGGGRNQVTWLEGLATIAACFACCYVIALLLEDKHLRLRRWLKDRPKLRRPAMQQQPETAQA